MVVRFGIFYARKNHETSVFKTNYFILQPKSMKANYRVKVVQIMKASKIIFSINVVRSNQAKKLISIRNAVIIIKNYKKMLKIYSFNCSKSQFLSTKYFSMISDRILL